MTTPPPNIRVPLEGGPLNTQHASVKQGQEVYEVNVVTPGVQKRKVRYVIDWTGKEPVGTYQSAQKNT